MNLIKAPVLLTGWALWVAICLGGSSWAYTEFQQCQSADTCFFLTNP